MSFKKPFSFVVILIILIVFQAGYGKSHKGTVNILGWYGIQSPEVTSAIRDECGVEVSFDEYYSEGECLKRISTVEDGYLYDVVIFPSDIYELIKKKIKLTRSDLNKVVKYYSHNFRDHYLSCNYPSNVVYFSICFVGFIWNPLLLELSPTDSIYSIFKKAKNNIAIIMNSPTGTWVLIDRNQKLSSNLLGETFKEIIGDADIYIANGYNKLYGKDNFAFAFQPSGEAVFAIKASKNKDLRFFVHPKYSYAASDLMAELNTRPETRCVARILASKKVLDIVQAKTYYLSPYGTYKLVNDPIFRKVYQQLFDGEYKIRWFDSLYIRNKEEHNERMQNELRDMWAKIHMLPQVIKNHSLVLKRKSECCDK